MAKQQYTGAKAEAADGASFMENTAAGDRRVYLAQDIQNLLGIGRSRCYTYLEEVYQNQKPFRVIKIGKPFRIPKQPFDEWLNSSSYTSHT